MKRLALPFAALLLAVGATPAASQDFAITGATVATGDGSAPIENATVVVRGGKVVAVGSDIAVTMDMPTIDGRGKWVTPGIFALMTDLGLWDVSGVRESNDTSARGSSFGAALDVAPALVPESQNVAISRAGGVTRASVASFPSSQIFGGQGAVVDLGADADMVMRPRAFQFVTLGERGGAIAGGSRTAAFVTLKNALQEAQDLASKGGRHEDALLTRPDAAALLPVLRGEEPLYVHVERAAHIRSVLDLRKDYPKLRLVLVGASEGWLVASDIAAAGVPVIADSLDDLPVTFEQLAATQSNVGRMKRAGVKVALGGFAGMEQPRNAKQYAGNLVALSKLPRATGLSWGEAFAAITSVPAEIAGYGGKLGVLKPGAVGDVVIWDGDPLEVSSAPERVFIDGVEQPRDNHQTRLRDRYRDLDESDLPKAYDW
ncbi:MAG: amidohydrolase family protein [Sphingomonadales bacterium]|nr:amidohydrolase family protein [Sphingomonadales bacterium]MBD3772899.1 amidohydrolase family protein [Paracoccaceae bacterium]